MTPVSSPTDRLRGLRSLGHVVASRRQPRRLVGAVRVECLWLGRVVSQALGTFGPEGRYSPLPSGQGDRP